MKQTNFEIICILAVITGVIVCCVMGAWVGYSVCQQDAVDNGAAYYDENGKFQWFGTAQ